MSYAQEFCINNCTLTVVYPLFIHFSSIMSLAGSNQFCSTIKEKTELSHCRISSLQYSCLESIEVILNRIASIPDSISSQSVMYAYFFEVNASAVKGTTRFPSSYSNLLMNYLLASKRTTDNLLKSIVILGSSFRLNSLVVPRNFDLKPGHLEPIIGQFQLHSIDLSYCQFVDNSLVKSMVRSMTFHAQPLRMLVLKGTMFTQISLLTELTELECLDLSELNYLQPIQGSHSVQDYIQYIFGSFKQLSKLNIYSTNLSCQKECMPSFPFNLLNRNCQLLRPIYCQNQIVHLDISCSQTQTRPTWMADQVQSFMNNLATISSLKYLDVSFWPIALTHLQCFSDRNNALDFLGILGTNILKSNSLLNAVTNEFTSTFDEASIINSIRQYGYRRDYINYIVNFLIEEVDKDAHQFQFPDQLVNAMLDLIEANYLYNRTSYPLPIHMPTFVDITYIISRTLDKVFLEHLPSNTLKRLVFDFIEMIEISTANISCNSELLLNIFTVLVNFNVVEFSFYLDPFLPDIFKLVLKLLDKYGPKIKIIGSKEHNLLEITALVLSNYSWNHLKEDSKPQVDHFLQQLIKLISDLLPNPADPLLGYLSTVLMNISCYQPFVCQCLVSANEQLWDLLCRAQDSMCTCVVENICGCFEHVMDSYLRSDADLSDWGSIHRFVEYAFTTLASHTLDEDMISSLSATIVYYWYAIEKTKTAPLIVEQDVTLSLVKTKLSEIQYYIRGKFDYVNIEAPLACLDSNNSHVQYFALWMIHGCLKKDFNKFSSCLVGSQHLDRIISLQYSVVDDVNVKAVSIASLLA